MNDATSSNFLSKEARPRPAAFWKTAPRALARSWSSKMPQGAGAAARTPRGLTLIDVVVGVAVMVMIFLAIFSAFRISIELVFSTKAKTGAVSLMAERLEYIRSLPYGSVGTLGGIPAGPIPQLEQTTLNGISYTIRTLVQYTDAPEDGLDTADMNAITADYKTVKVETLWSVKDSARSTFAVTRISPPGIETLADGGTLKVGVFDASVNPVGGATVHIVNAGAAPTVDVSVSTNQNGAVSFPGAPEAGGYEVTVSKNSYSNARTYSATAENPNPSPAHIAVVDEQTTSINFFIDVLGSLRFRTFEPVGAGSFNDPFLDQSKLSATTSVAVVGGALTLQEIENGVWAEDGSARSTPIAPLLLASWNAVSFSQSTPVGTSVSVRVYYLNGGAYDPVPDTDLPGNTVGFSSSPINISALSKITYGTLQLGAALHTSDITTTPAIEEWGLSYTAGPTPLPGVSFTIHGSKTIGMNGATPVYKYASSFSTDQSAEWFIGAVEWDVYTVTLSSSYDIAERCPNDIVVSPGQNLEPYYHLAPNTTNSLRIYIADGGTPISGATVSLSGVSGTRTSSSCGQTYWGGLINTTYTVTITKPGFATHQETIPVSGDVVLVVGLTPQ